MDERIWLEWVGKIAPLLEFTLFRPNEPVLGGIGRLAAPVGDDRLKDDAELEDCGPAAVPEGEMEGLEPYGADPVLVLVLDDALGELM